MTSASVLRIRDAIIEQALPHVIFDGWGPKLLQTAAPLAEVSLEKAHAIFPGGASDLVDGFADWADRQMEAKLAKIDPSKMRVRDRVRLAVLTRLEVLASYKEAERLAAIFWAVPTRTPRVTKVLWRSADRIWNWAGDTATDYNRYTKRGLLSGVLATTTLAWLDDESPDMDVTRAFLDRRIENVMSLGGLLGRIKAAKPGLKKAKL